MTENTPESTGGTGDEPTTCTEPPHRVPGSESSGTDGSVHWTSYDTSTDGSLGAAVVVAIADATGTATRDIDPLYETVDPDALAALFAPNTTEDSRRSGTISFVHYGCHVTIEGTEIVVDTEPSGR